jgi:hypothetical protein
VRTNGVVPGTAGFVISLGCVGSLGAWLASRAARRRGGARTYLVASVAAALLTTSARTLRDAIQRCRQVRSFHVSYRVGATVLCG